MIGAKFLALIILRCPAKKSDLVSLIEGGGAYRLSAEYYEEIEIDNVSFKNHKINRKLKDSDLF